MEWHLKKFYIGLAVFVIIVLINVLWHLDKSKSSFECELQKGFYGKRYSGKVIAKFVEIHNHNYNRIILKERNIEFSVYDFNHDRSNIFSLVAIGDSLIKDIDSDYIRIKGERTDTIVQVDYGCEGY